MRYSFRYWRIGGILNQILKLNLHWLRSIQFPNPFEDLHCTIIRFAQWGTGVKTNAKGGADAQLGEKQWMWLTSWKSHDVVPNSQGMTQSATESANETWVGMTFPIALSTSPSSPSCVSTPRIGLVPPVPHWFAGRYMQRVQHACHVTNLSPLAITTMFGQNTVPNVNTSINRNHVRSHHGHDGNRVMVWTWDPIMVTKRQPVAIRHFNLNN
jgi:hypothetical protein